MNNDEISLVWAQLCTLIRGYDDVSEVSFDAFAAHLQPQVMSSNYLMLTADKAFIRDWVEMTYKQKLIRGLKEITGETYQIDIEVDPNQAVPQPAAPQVVPAVKPESSVETQPKPVQIPAERQLVQVQATPLSQETFPQSREVLSKSERFNNFVIGDSNRIAYQMAIQVASEPGKIANLNPLFIFGKSGLGKTHLLRAIQNEIYETIPGFNVVYTDTIDLVSALTEASLEKNRDKLSFKQFTKKYMDADVLLVDDVQMLTGKNQTVQNLFQFINSFKSEGKQIVLAADRSPRNILLDERYTSRFVEGMVTEIVIPSVETKLAIIKNCLEDYRREFFSDFNLPENVQMYIAEMSSSNIRELKGAISQVTFNFDHREGGWQSITENDVEKLLEYAFSGKNKRLTVSDIQREAADFYKISVTDLVSSKRSRPIAHARQVAIYLCQKMLELTQSEIGKFFGGRDHSTVMYSITTVATQMKENRELKDEVALLEQIIREA